MPIQQHIIIIYLGIHFVYFYIYRNQPNDMTKITHWQRMDHLNKQTRPLNTICRQKSNDWRLRVLIAQKILEDNEESSLPQAVIIVQTNFTKYGTTADQKSMVS